MIIVVVHVVVSMILVGLDCRGMDSDEPPAAALKRLNCSLSISRTSSASCAPCSRAPTKSRWRSYSRQAFQFCSAVANGLMQFCCKWPDANSVACTKMEILQQTSCAFQGVVAYSNLSAQTVKRSAVHRYQSRQRSYSRRSYTISVTNTCVCIKKEVPKQIHCAFPDVTLCMQQAVRTYRHESSTAACTQTNSRWRSYSRQAVHLRTWLHAERHMHTQT